MFTSKKCAFCRFENATVECLVCKTSYHEDCWKTNESRCSCYGCPSIHHSGQLLEFQKVYRKAINSPLPEPRREFPSSQQMGRPSASYGSVDILVYLGMSVLILSALILFFSFPETQYRKSPVYEVYDSEESYSFSDDEEEDISRQIPVGFKGEYLVVFDGDELRAVKFDGLSREQAWRLFLLSSESLLRTPLGTIKNMETMSASEDWFL